MTRAKDKPEKHNHVLEGLSPEILAFNEELSQYFPNINYTSGKRSANQKIGTNYKTSHHNTGNAFDISASDKEVYQFLTSKPEGIALLAKHNLGILDETDPETMKKTGATAGHFHIGKDSKYVKEAQDRYKSILELQANNPQAFTTRTMEIVTPENIVKTVTLDDFKKEIEQGKERQEDLDKKVVESPRRRVIEKRKQELDFINTTLGQQSEPISYYGTQEEEQPYEISQIEIQPPQQQMPILPQLFQTQLPTE